MGAVAKSYMRKGFLIFEEMRKYLVLYEEAVSHIWLCNRSLLDFLIFEEIFFFFISAAKAGKYSLALHRLDKPRKETLSIVFSESLFASVSTTFDRGCCSTPLFGSYLYFIDYFEKNKLWFAKFFAFYLLPASGKNIFLALSGSNNVSPYR